MSNLYIEITRRKRKCHRCRNPLGGANFISAGEKCLVEYIDVRHYVYLIRHNFCYDCSLKIIKERIESLVNLYKEFTE